MHDNGSVNNKTLNTTGSTGTFFSDDFELRYASGYAVRYAITDATTGADAFLAGEVAIETLNFDTKANTVAGDYVVVYDTTGQPWSIAASPLGIAEVTTITAVADVSDSLDATYFLLQDTDGSVAFWIDTDDSGTTIPAGATAADRAVEITTITTEDTAVTIGGLLRTAIGADGKFGTSGSGADCIVTNADIQALTDAADGDTGFAFVTDTQGSLLGAEPTGAIWLAIAAGNKAQVDISGDTTDVSVAASFEVAFDALSGFTALIVTDDTAADGTMLMTNVVRGPVTATAVKDEDDSGAGSIAAATTNAGIASAINVTDDEITSTSHGLVTGAKGQLTTDGTLPAGLSLATDYFVIRIDDDTFQLATSLVLAQAGTQVDITDQGDDGDTHTFTPIALSGTVTFQVAVDDSPVDADYVDLSTPSPNAFTGAETVFENISDAYYRFVRLKFEVTDGTMAGNVVINGK